MIILLSGRNGVRPSRKINWRATRCRGRWERQNIVQIKGRRPRGRPVFAPRWRDYAVASEDEDYCISPLIIDLLHNRAAKRTRQRASLHFNPLF